MTDYLIKAMTTNGAFRMLAVDAQQLVSQAQIQHDTWPTATAALGRTLMGTLLLSSALLKDDEKLTVRIGGNGPLGPIVVDGNAHGEVRGYVTEPHLELPRNRKHKLDVRGAVGTEGLLAVSKDLGLKQPFVGQVPLVSGEIAEDFTYYLAQSEQIPSSMGLSVFVRGDGSVATAGGFLIQTLPGATDEQLTDLEQRLANLPALSDLFRDGITPEQLLNQIFDADKVKILATEKVAFKCDCSKHRFSKSLAALAPSELRELVEQENEIETVCKFCGKKYLFTRAELAKMLPTE